MKENYTIPANPKLKNGRTYNELQDIVLKYIPDGTSEYYSAISELLLFIGMEDEKFYGYLKKNII